MIINLQTINIKNVSCYLMGFLTENDYYRRIVEQKAGGGSVYTITLSGHPFTNSSLGDTDSACVSLRAAWCHLLSELSCQGWQIVTTSDLAQKRCNSTIFFRYTNCQKNR